MSSRQVRIAVWAAVLLIVAVVLMIAIEQARQDVEEVEEITRSQPY
jgi:hypothetical protein